MRFRSPLIGSLVLGTMLLSGLIPVIAQNGGGIITRAEAIQTIVETWPESTDLKTPPLPLYWDMTQSSWFASSVEVAFEKGMLRSTAERRFHPQGPLTVGQAFLWKLRLIQPTHLLADRDELKLTTDDVVALRGALEEAGSVVLDEDDSELIGRASLRALFAVQDARDVSSEIATASSFSSFSSSSSFSFETSSASSAWLQTYRPSLIDVPVIGSSFGTSSSSSLGRSSVAYGDDYLVPFSPGSHPSVRGRDEEQYVSTLPYAITIPSLGMRDLPIIHPRDPASSASLLEVLKRGVGHLFSYPGNGGKILVYGHSSGYPWDVSEFTRIFRRINELNIGDKIYVTYEGRLFVYQVTLEETVPARDLMMLQEDGETGEQLVLYTCWPPDDISHRYLVRAAPIATYQL